MNRQETKQVLAYLAAAYRDFAGGRDAKQVMAVWCDLFADDPVEMVQAAVKAYVSANKFPPSPADIRAEMARIISPAGNEMQAWALLHKAISNGFYNSNAEWKKLPDDIREMVTPSQLHSWATMDTAQLESVVQSNFLRSYRAMRAEKQRFAMLPPSMQATLKSADNCFQAIEAPGEANGRKR